MDRPDPETGTDKTDKPINEGPLSVLSVRPLGLLDEKMVNMPFTFSNGSGLVDEYEERRSIAEYDGHQTSIQAQRIAYLDTFLAVLATLPYENTTEDWLAHRIKKSQEWLVNQGLVQPK